MNTRSSFHRRRHTTALAALGIALLTAQFAEAIAIAEHLLLTSDLRLLRGVVTSIGPTTVSFRDAGGLDVVLPAEQCVGFLDLAIRSAGRTDPGVLVLADGQRFPGRPELRQGRLVWVNPLLGAVRIDLESLRGISLRPGIEPPAATERDVVLLSNGDRLEGVVDALGTELTLVQGEGAEASTVQVPLERVDAFGLVTPTKVSASARIWLEDGTVADVERPILESDGQIHLRGFLDAAETRAHGVPMSIVRGARLLAGTSTPLAAMPIARTVVPPERLFAPAATIVDPTAPLGLSSMRISGPVEMTWSLPKDARRFVATARLPDEARPWGDLELVILDGQGERWRGHLGPGATSMAVDVALRDASLTIRLEEGRFGPIGDILLLETPAVGSGAKD